MISGLLIVKDVLIVIGLGSDIRHRQNKSSSLSSAQLLKGKEAIRLAGSLTVLEYLCTQFVDAFPADHQLVKAFNAFAAFDGTPSSAVILGKHESQYILKGTHQASLQVLLMPCTYRFAQG